MTFSTHGVVHKVPLTKLFEPPRIVKGFPVKIRHVLDFLVFSSLFLALECVAMTCISCLIQEIPPSFPMVIIPFLVTFGIYNLNRKTDESEDAINHEARFRFTKRYENALFGCSLATIALALIITGYSNLPSLLITLTPFVLGTLYSVRWLPSRSPYRRLKEVPFAKNLIVCISWAVPGSLLPVYLSGGTPGVKTVITCLLFFSWGFLASTSPDIRDRIGDAAAGVRTIPVILGEEMTRRMMTGWNLIFGAAVLFFGYLFLDLRMTLLLAATIIYAQICIHLLGRGGMRYLVCDILADGQYIFFGGAIMVLVALHVPL